MHKIVLLPLLAFTLSVNAHQVTKRKVSKGTRQLCQGFLPPNKMYIPVDNSPAAAMAKAKFDEILNKVQQVYGPIIAAKGGRLKIERRWTDGTVNAYADRRGRNWTIVMFGGFARHPAVTPDAFTAVACHEIGHHIGGTPKYGRDWASVEGQSDYFANLKCLRRIFESEDNQAALNGVTLDPVAVRDCNAQHSSQQDQLVCIRATMAALSLAKVLAEGEPKVAQLDTPDTTQVSRTDENHPQGQCRLDTLFEASLCRVPFAQDLSDRDYQVGACYTPEHSRGARPRCWFAPN